MSLTAEKISARERLLAAATELFYEEGIHAVGVDRIIDRAGVAKASLYNIFGSKEELVRAYLEAQHHRRQKILARYVDNAPTPRERLLAVFSGQAEIVNNPTFRGCSFINVSAEGPSNPAIAALTGEFRGTVRNLFLQLAKEAGVKNAKALTDQLVLLYDGVTIAVQMDRNTKASKTASALAAEIVDAALETT